MGTRKAVWGLGPAAGSKTGGWGLSCGMGKGQQCEGCPEGVGTDN